MKTVHGVYTSAKIFNTNTTEYSIDDYAIAQLQALCDNEAFKESVSIEKVIKPIFNFKAVNN